MSTGKRLFWVSRFLILNLLLAIAFSWRLWFDFEQIPQVPVFDQLPQMLPTAQKILAAAALTYLFIIALFPKSRLPFGIGVLLLCLAAVQDWNRIQPWLVQCIGMLILLIPLQRLYRKYESLDYLEWAFRLSLVGFYCWAGIFKINPSFNETVIPYLVSPVTNFLSSFKPQIHAISSVVPYLEILLSFGLLFSRLSKYAVFALIGFHALILLLLGPLGLNTNPIVWIWNVSLIAILWIGIGTKKPQYNFKFWFKTQRITWIALAAFTVLPVLNYFNWYNKSVAFEIYSGTNYVANLKMPLKSIGSINPTIEPYSYKFRDSLFIRTYDLYNEEYNLPPNPDPKVMAKLERRIQEKMQ